MRTSAHSLLPLYIYVFALTVSCGLSLPKGVLPLISRLTPGWLIRTTLAITHILLISSIIMEYSTGKMVRTLGIENSLYDGEQNNVTVKGTMLLSRYFKGIKFRGV